MEKSLYKNYKVFTQKSVFDHPCEAKWVLENAWCAPHVQHVHPSTVKSCRVVESFGDVVVLIYELYPVPILRFLTQEFLVIKSRSQKTDTEYQFLSFPINSVVSCLTIKSTPSKVGGGSILEHTFKLKLPRALSWLGKVMIYFRNRGEKKRFDEDIVIISKRAEAVKNGHKDDERCVRKVPLIETWFSEK